MKNLPYADDVAYWKTGTSSPDTWIDKTIRVVKELGGVEISQFFGHGENAGGVRTAISHRRRIVSSCLASASNARADDFASAQRQAATLLYHDCKAKAIAASVLGPRNAFIGSLITESGKTVSELATPLIANSIKPLLLTSTNH